MLNRFSGKAYRVHCHFILNSGGTILISHRECDSKNLNAVASCLSLLNGRAIRPPAPAAQF